MSTPGCVTFMCAEEAMYRWRECVDAQMLRRSGVLGVKKSVCTCVVMSCVRVVVVVVTVCS